MATKAEIIGILNVLGAAYPAVRLMPETIVVYTNLLSDLSREALMTAAQEHVARSTFFPTVAELRQAALDLVAAANPLPDAYAAWAEVQSEIRRVGYKGEPQFSHPLIAETVALFGWRYLCLSENGMADRSHFVQAYKPRQEQADNKARMLPATRVFVAGQRAALAAHMDDEK